MDLSSVRQPLLLGDRRRVGAEEPSEVGLGADVTSRESEQAKKRGPLL